MKLDVFVKRIGRWKIFLFKMGFLRGFIPHVHCESASQRTRVLKHTVAWGDYVLSMTLSLFKHIQKTSVGTDFNRLSMKHWKISPTELQLQDRFFCSSLFLCLNFLSSTPSPACFSPQQRMLALLGRRGICRRHTVNAKGNNDCGTKLKAETKSNLAKSISWADCLI